MKFFWLVVHHNCNIISTSYFANSETRIPLLGAIFIPSFHFLSRYFLYFSQFGGGFHRLNFALACRSTLTLPRKPNYDSYVFIKRTNLYFYSLNYSITLNLEIFHITFYYNCQCNTGFLVTDLRQKMRI